MSSGKVPFLHRLGLYGKTKPHDVVIRWKSLDCGSQTGYVIAPLHSPEVLINADMQTI